MYEKLAIVYDENGIVNEYENRHRFNIESLFEEGEYAFLNESYISYPKTEIKDIRKLKSYLISLYSLLEEAVDLEEDEVELFKDIHRQARKLSNKLDFCDNTITHLLFMRFQEKNITNNEIEKDIFESLDINTQSLTMNSFALSWPISYPFLKKDIALIEKMLPKTIINDKHNLLTGFDKNSVYPLTGIELESYQMQNIYMKSVMDDFNINKEHDPYFEGNILYICEREIGYSPSKEILLYLLFLQVSDLDKENINSLKEWAQNNAYIKMTEKQAEGILYLKTKNYRYELENFEDWNFATGQGSALVECFNKCNFREDDDYLNIILKQSKKNIESFNYKNPDLIKIMLEGLDKNKTFSFEFKRDKDLVEEVNHYCDLYKKIEEMYVIENIHENRTSFTSCLSNVVNKILQKRVDRGDIEAEKECLTLLLTIKNNLQAFINNKVDVSLLKQKVNRL